MLPIDVFAYLNVCFVQCGFHLWHAVYLVLQLVLSIHVFTCVTVLFYVFNVFFHCEFLPKVTYFAFDGI